MPTGWPTNGLDPAGILEIRDLVRGFSSDHGITVFLSSHLLAEVEQIATHVGIVGLGRLLFEGTLFATTKSDRALTGRTSSTRAWSWPAGTARTCGSRRSRWSPGCPARC